MIRRATAFAKREAKTIIKFVVVGGTSFIVYIGAYTLQSRFLFPGAPDEARVIMNVAASCLSVLFNYLAHRFWTYRAKETNIQQIAWYAFVAGSVTFLQTFLFWIGHVVLGLFDYLVILLVGMICACYTFLMHRYFTFRPRSGG
ncbi:GtrA family protein [Patescibacteria group bacterium]|jgi:putative flippase GtrA|nr:GtrA family protein [Patescibacteria group bacterium]